MRSPGAPSCSAVASVLTVKPLAIATSSTWSPRRTIGSARACGRSGGGGRLAGLGRRHDRHADAPAQRRAAHGERAGDRLADLDRLRAGLRGAGAGRSAWSRRPARRYWRPARRRRDCPAFRDSRSPAPAPAAARASTAKGNATRRKFGTMTVTPDISEQPSNCRAKPLSCGSEIGDSSGRRRASGLRPWRWRCRASREAAFAQRPADRGGPRGGEFEAVEPAAILAGAGADDPDGVAREACALRAQRRPGLGLQQRLARLEDFGGVEERAGAGVPARSRRHGAAAAVDRDASIAWSSTKQPSSSSSRSAKLTAQRGNGRRFMPSAATVHAAARAAPPSPSPPRARGRAGARRRAPARRIRPRTGAPAAPRPARQMPKARTRP